MDKSTVSWFAKILEFRSRFEVVFVYVCGPLAACFLSSSESSLHCRHCETSDVAISLTNAQILALESCIANGIQMVV